MRRHGEGGHFVNTASMAGLLSGMGFSPYTASKFAVIAMSEGIAPQLKPLGIGISVLCPGFVRTRISDSWRNRPAHLPAPQPLDPASPAAAIAAEIAQMVQDGLDPSVVAAQVLQAIRDDQFYVFTHPEYRVQLVERHAAIMAAMDKLPPPG
jgi:NAD(P)-dependent dehydrogenase (short-subunit alcohol dehydrogenase family)